MIAASVSVSLHRLGNGAAGDLVLPSSDNSPVRLRRVRHLVESPTHLSELLPVRELN